MADKDIIQVLQYIVENGSGACDKCPVFPCGKIKDYEDNQCSRFIAEKALDLINRQKAEIERLQKEANLVSIQFQDMQERQEESQAEIDKLNAENMLTMSERNAFRTSFYEILKQLKTAKSEAIKEFAERLKETITNEIDTYYNSNGGGYYLAEDTIEDIDNLVKQMAGENNG